MMSFTVDRPGMFDLSEALLKEFEWWLMVGPPRFELESMRPERTSMDQANPRALVVAWAPNREYI